MPTILVVEDDDAARMLTAARLKPYFDVKCACDGEEALRVMDRHPVDLAIVDAMMPNMGGYELVEQVRAANFNLPLLMLTALDSFSAKRDGFHAGVDDYLTKPVNYDELLWRVRALLRRAKVSASKRIEIGDMVFDATSYTVSQEGRRSDMPRKEFDLLFVLLSYPGTIFTKDQLLDRVWGFHSEGDEATLKTHISRLRARFSDCGSFEIVNIRGLGYKVEITQDDEEG